MIMRKCKKKKMVLLKEDYDEEEINQKKVMKQRKPKRTHTRGESKNLV